MFDRSLLLAAFSAALFAFPATACEQHEKTAKLPPSTGQIYFQPAAPDEAEEGEIWIDARNGRQLVLVKGEWVLREIASRLLRPAS